MGNTRRKSKAKGKSKSKFQRERKDRLFKAVFGRNTEKVARCTGLPLEQVLELQQLPAPAQA